jgi:hypothetical protein
MRIGYVSLDEVHEYLVRQTAEARGAEYCALPTAVSPSAVECDVVIYDLDYLPTGHRQAVLAELLSGRARQRTAVHGYNLRTNQARRLCRRGVIVARTPESCLSRVLASLAAKSPTLAFKTQPSSAKLLTDAFRDGSGAFG